MQQVAAGSRFWWRVQEAPSPIEPASAAAHAFAPAFATPRHAAAARHDPLDDLTLRVPRADRRRVRARAQRPLPRWLLVTIVGAILIAAGVVTTASDASSRIEFETYVADASTRALVGAGLGIEQVSITGHRFVLDSDVFDAIDLPNVRTFADLDADAVLKRIERISWVDKAQITRVYPGTLAIQISERTPAFLWKRGATEYLIDATGRLLGPAPKGGGWRLPRVAGEGAPKEAEGLFNALARQPEVARHLAFAERVAERRWRLVLTSGSEIELAADRENEGLADLITHRTLLAELASKPAVLDLRTPGRTTIRPLAALRQVPTGAATKVAR